MQSVHHLRPGAYTLRHLPGEKWTIQAKKRSCSAGRRALPHRRTALGAPAQFWSDPSAAHAAIPPRAHEGENWPHQTPRRPPRAGSLTHPPPSRDRSTRRPSSCCSKSTRWSRSPRPRFGSSSRRSCACTLARCRRGSRTAEHASDGLGAVLQSLVRVGATLERGKGFRAPRHAVRRSHR